MQLLYLFIEGRVKPEILKYHQLEGEPYKVIQNVGFNFSNEYLINYELQSGALSINRNPIYVPNFFDETGKIKSLTGIIGKNGAGKSSILDFIKMLRPNCYGDIFHKYIAVFCYEEVLQIPHDDIKTHSEKKFKIYVHPDLKINTVKKDSTIKESFSEREIFLTKTKSHYSEPELPNYTIVYYSNILEIKPYTIKNTKKFEDISVTSLLEQDAETQVNSSTKLFTGEEMLRRHRLMESERQIKFIFHQNPKKYLDFKIPQYAELSIEDFDERIVNKNINEKGNYNMLFNSFNSKEQATQGLSIKQKFIFSLHRSAFFNVFRYFLDTPLDFNLNNNTIDAVSKDCTPENIRLFIDSVREEFNTHLKNNRLTETPEGNIFERLKKLNTFLLQTETFIEDNFNGTNHHDCKLTIDLSPNSDGYAYTANYFSSVNLSGFILMNLRISKTSPGELSSGEKSLINFFARLNYVRERTITYKNLENNNFLFLIDEGDQLFHPEWQRKYIKNITSYLPVLFSKAETLQIILTSHSPFIASDLPPFALIVLDKAKESDLTIVKKPDIVHSTFAANIHELFAEKFFLENFIGEFATHKLEDLIKRVKEYQYKNDEDLQIIINEIKLVGEVFFREKLFSILRKNFVKKPLKNGSREKLIELIKLPDNDKRVLDKIDSEFKIVRAQLKQYWDAKDLSK
jgi:hypothetical protein